MKLATLTCLAACCTISAAQAAVVVTDNGTTAPTIGANDTGYTGAPTDRFGWDAGETWEQTFTVANAGTIDNFYLGYNAFDDGETITLTLSVNGSEVATGIVVDGDNFSGSSGTDTSTGPTYWMAFDLSSESVAVNAGSNSIALEATADSGESWALAPLWTRPNPYGGGQALGVVGAGNNGDMLFAVTVVPEPGSLALLGLGGLLIARRRRRA